MRAVLAIVTLLFASPSFAQSLTVVTLDRTNQSTTTLEREQKEAARLFTDAGVEIVWAATVPTTGRFVRLVIDRAPAFPERPMPDGAMGVAVEPSVAYVFTGDADRVARTHQIEATTVLGMVIAHELTHLMLSQAHATSGLMKARWTAADFLDAKAQRFSIDRETAGKLRAAVMAMRPPGPRNPD